jgi:hypothetical protein
MSKKPNKIRTEHPSEFDEYYFTERNVKDLYIAHFYVHEPIRQTPQVAAKVLKGLASSVGKLERGAFAFLQKTFIPPYISAEEKEEKILNTTTTNVITWLETRKLDAPCVDVGSGYGRPKEMYEVNWNVTVGSFGAISGLERMPFNSNDWYISIAVRAVPTLQDWQHRLGWPSAMIDVVRSVAEPYSGFFCCVNTEAALAGLVFTQQEYGGQAQQFIDTDAVWWHPMNDRSKKVRGVYWGNYFGPKLAKMIRTKCDVIDAFEHHENQVDEDRIWKPLTRPVHYPDGAVFIALTPDIADDSPDGVSHFGAHDAVASELKAWMHIKLRDAGLLA